MKLLKSIRKRDFLFVAIIIGLSIVLYAQYNALNQSKMESLIAASIKESIVSTPSTDTHQTTQDIVNDIVTNEIITETEHPTTSNNSIGAVVDAAKDQLNNINTNQDSTSNIKIIEIESSNKLIIEQDGKQYKIRLIGVHSNGSSKALLNILEQSTDLRIETDTKKTEGDYKLVYLWNGEPLENGTNMINLMMVSNEFAYSTYDFVHPGIIETPNIKYQQLFITAIKNQGN